MEPKYYIYCDNENMFYNHEENGEVFFSEYPIGRSYRYDKAQSEILKLRKINGFNYRTIMTLRYWALTRLEKLLED
jgi:hypothetical protein